MGIFSLGATASSDINCFTASALLPKQRSKILSTREYISDLSLLYNLHQRYFTTFPSKKIPQVSHMPKITAVKPPSASANPKCLFFYMLSVLGSLGSAWVEADFLVVELAWVGTSLLESFQA
jgi:hypothetical protein